MKEFISQKKQAFQALSQQNKFFQPGIIVVVVLLAGVGIYLIVKSFAATAPQTLTFAPSADATLNRGAANTNYGNGSSLLTVAGSSSTIRKDFLIKFNVSGIAGKKIDSIKIKLYATNSSGSGGRIYGTYNTLVSSDNSTTSMPDWTDTSVTWNNAYRMINPPVISSIGTVSAGHWYSFDVTSAVKHDGTYTFRVATRSTNNVVYASKEYNGGAYAPQVVALVEPQAEIAVQTQTAPTAPTNLTGFTVDANRVDLGWTLSTDDQGVVGYYVYANGVKVDETNLTAPLLPARMTGGLKPSTQYSIYLRAYDATGNLSPASNTITLTTNSATPPTGSCTTAESVKINFNTVSTFSCESINNLLKGSAYPGDFAKIAPLLTINVQDTVPSQVQTPVSYANGTYTNYTATLYFKAVNSTASLEPNAQLGHEYGHVWTLYNYYLNHNKDWTGYYNTRWDTEDGTVKLGQDPLLNTAYQWTDSEIIADDYRLLFGSPLAIGERDKHLNPDIVDPRLQPGLKDWLLHTWANE